MTHFEIWLSDAQGTRLALLDRVQSLTYVLSVNHVGWWSLTLPESALRSSVLRPDLILSVWRDTGSKLRAEFAGFVRQWEYFDNTAGATYLTLAGPTVLELLDRRIIAYTAGSAEAAQTDHVDDMMKAIVRQNLGSSASAARDLTDYGLMVQADTSLGLSLERRFAWQNVLTVLQNLSEASVAQDAPIYFDIVPIFSANAITLEFQTFPDQRGVDRRYSSGAPIVFGKEWGNLANPRLVFDYSDERNYIYVGGQGEGAFRQVEEITNAVRTGASVWNRRELFLQAADEETTAGLQNRGQAALENCAPKMRFNGSLLSVPGCLYGEDWFLGDRVTASYAGRQFDGMITPVRVSLSEEGEEQVDSRLEVEV